MPLTFQEQVKQRLSFEEQVKQRLEGDFQEWYSGYAKRNKLDPNPDDPRHFYDYRAAFRAGAKPSRVDGDRREHLPSKYKLPGHPNQFVDGVDTITGRKANFEDQVKQRLTTEVPQVAEVPQDRPELIHARKELEESLLPSFKAFGVAAGAPIVSVGARILGMGDYADRMNRHAAAMEQAQREREEGGPVPDILQSGIRGAGASLVTMAGAGMVGGPYAMIATAAIQEGNRAITEGKDAGKKGTDLAAYSVSQGIIEGLPAWFMQKIGLGGAESLVSKGFLANGIKQALKRLGISAAQEMPEEWFTEITHAVLANIADVEKITPKDLVNIGAETTVQTLLTVGLGGIPSVGRSIEVGRIEKIKGEMVESTEGDMAPSVRDWRRWGISPELGLSRKQRKAFVREFTRRLEPEVPRREIVAAVPGLLSSQGGFTLDKYGREGIEVSPDRPWAVSVKGEEEVFDHAPTTEEIEGYLDRHDDDTGKTFFGGWVNEETGKYYLDRTITFAGKQEAMEAGINNEQEAIFNLETKETVSLVAPETAAPAEPPTEVVPEAEVAPAAVPEGQEAVMEPPTAAVGPPLDAEVAEVAPAVEAIQEAPGEAEGALGEVAEDPTVALNKAEAIRIRDEQGFEQFPEPERESAETITAEVLATKADERAMEVTAQILVSPRALTTHEYIAMVVKSGKLMDEQSASQVLQGEAAAVGNKVAYEQAITKGKVINKQLDDLVAASMYASAPTARALNIRKTRLSREKFDVVHIMNRMQAIKGLSGRLTTEERELATRLASEYATKVQELEQIEQETRDAEEKRDAILAEKVMAANKPRKKIGRDIKQRARAEREDIKQRIRQMGLRVNDITGIPVEGVYLIGRLGITYIKEGAGTLIEVAELLQGDMPDLNLSQHDVNRALIARSPKEKIRAKSEATKRVRKLVSMARMHVELQEMADGVAKPRKGRPPLDADIKALRKKLTEARKIYYKSDIDAAKLERAIQRVNSLQDQIKNGRTKIERKPTEVPPELAAVQDQIRQLTMELRVDEELAKVNKQLQTGEYILPQERVKKTVNQKLAHKQTELTRKRREITQAISDAAPWTAGKVAKEIAFSAKAVAATADFSFTLRQNFWQMPRLVFTDPKKAAKVFITSIEAFLSENSADEINNAILHSDNAYLYEQFGLAILDANSPDAQQRSEVYRGRVIERAKIFGKQNPFGVLMSASARHAAIISNLIRTSAFDQFVADNPNATNEELRAIADYINVSTGLGNLGSFGAIGDKLQLAFFSPKFAVSRVQTPYKLYRYWNLPRVRKQIAGDMIGVVATGGMVLTLAYLAGFDVELLDPEDPDWGKIRIGNTRIDIWGGFQQPARLIARLATGKIIGGDADPLELLSRFAAFKLSPAVTIPIELWTGKTAVGEETAIPATLARSMVPLVARDVHEAWKEHGIPAAIGVGALAVVGVGVSTYEDSETGTRREIKKLKAKKKFAESEKLRLFWNRKHPKNRIVTVK